MSDEHAYENLCRSGESERESLYRRIAELEREHANALGTAAAEADARKRNLAHARELEQKLAQSDVLYAQVLLGQRVMIERLRELVNIHHRITDAKERNAILDEANAHHDYHAAIQRAIRALP